jgi:hypothetical protein
MCTRMWHVACGTWRVACACVVHVYVHVLVLVHVHVCMCRCLYVHMTAPVPARRGAGVPPTTGFLQGMSLVLSSIFLYNVQFKLPRLPRALRRSAD